MDIKLINRPILSDCRSKSDADSDGFDNRTKGINVVDAKELIVSLGNNKSFIAIKRVIGFYFLFIQKTRYIKKCWY